LARIGEETATILRANGSRARARVRDLLRELLENVCLFVLAVVVALRPMVGETYDTAVDSLTASLDAISSPSPLVSLGFDLLILGCAVLWLLIRAVWYGKDDLCPPRPYRRTGMEWGLALLLIAGIVSCCFAGNQRIAINAAIDWLCYPILTVVLVQVTPLAWQRRVLLSVILASACVQAYKCFEDQAGAGQTRENYELLKANGFWENQGVALDSPKVVLFERRLYSNESVGYLSHGNVTGAYLVMCGIAAVGVVIGRRGTGFQPVSSTGRNPAPRVLTILTAGLAAMIFVAAALTHSKGATGACAIGLVAWVFTVAVWRWFESHRRLFLVLCWLALAAGGAGVISYGLYHGSLPGASLDFRWQYWSASSHLVEDHVWTGVGRENFGREYLRYKTIDSPEEIANPHNLLVHSAAEWGIVGLAGVVSMLLGVSMVLSRPPIGHTPGSARDEKSRTGWIVLWCVGLGAAVFAVRVPLLGAGGLEPDEYFSFVYWVTAIPAFVWLISFCLIAVSFRRASRIAGVLSPVVLTAINAGLFAFIVQEMINFGLFIPGAATSVFALAAVAISGRSAPRSSPGQARPGLRWMTFAAATVGFVAVFIAFVVPVIRAQDFLFSGRYHARQPLTRASLTAQPAYREYAFAAEVDPLDPIPWAERADWLDAVAVAVEPLRTQAYQASVDSLRQAIRRDPNGVQHYRRLALILQAQARHTGRGGDYEYAFEATRGVVDLYPNDPSGWKLRGDCALEAGEATESRELVGAAVRSYRRALELDDARPAWEHIRRFNERRRREIENALQKASGTEKKKGSG